MRHWLQTHDPERRNVVISVTNTLYLNIWNNAFIGERAVKWYDLTFKNFDSPTRATTRTPRKTRRALQRMCMKTMETRVTARLNSLCLCLLRLPLKIWRTRKVWDNQRQCRWLAATEISFLSNFGWNSRKNKKGKSSSHSLISNL